MKWLKIGLIILSLLVVSIGLYVAFQGYLPASQEAIIRRATTSVRSLSRDFDNMHPTNYPLDPFSGDRLQVDPERGIVWSFGPDEVDDNAQILYDPTNGIESGGDIVGIIQKP